MGRFSRFDRLEQDRDAAPTPRGADLGRFEAAELRNPVPPAGTPTSPAAGPGRDGAETPGGTSDRAAETADSSSAPVGAPPGQRAEATRPASAATQPTPERFAPPPEALTDPRADVRALLPDLECPACGTTDSKFASHCRTCGAAFDAPAAQAHNLARAEQLAAQRAAEQSQRDLSARAAIEDTRRQQEALRERMTEWVKNDQRAHRFERWAPALGGVRVAAAAALLLLLRFAPLPVARAGLCVVLPVLLVTLPASAWRFLGKHRRRGWFGDD